VSLTGEIAEEGGKVVGAVEQETVAEALSLVEQALGILERPEIPGAADGDRHVGVVEELGMALHQSWVGLAARGFPEGDARLLDAVAQHRRAVGRLVSEPRGLLPDGERLLGDGAAPRLAAASRVGPPGVPAL